MRLAALALALALALVLGCAQEPKPTPAQRAAAEFVRLTLSERDSIDAARSAFDPGEAVPDSGLLHIEFTVSRYDNAGTCANPIPDSTSLSPIYARVFTERRDYSSGVGVDYARAESLWVQRGSTVVYERRVPCDTFTVNVRSCKPGMLCDRCQKYITLIVKPSLPPKVEVLP